LKLEVAVIDISPTRKELSIEVGADAVRAEYEKAYEAYSRHAQVPGFRPGRVPRSVLRQRYSKEVKGEVLSQLVPHALSHAISDHKIHAVGEPSISMEEISLVEGEPLRFKAGFDIIPSFELGTYRGIPVTRRVVQVLDEDIDQVISRFQNANGELVPVEDRPSEAGDAVTIDLVGKYLDPPEEEDLKTDGLNIELGAEGVHLSFNEHLTGVRPGEVRTFEVHYPEDFSSPGLAGKKIAFTANVSAVRRNELPTPEELVELVRPGLTVDEFRAEIRRNLETHQAERADRKVKEDLLTSLLQNLTFEMPEKLIQGQKEMRSRQYLQQLFSSGLAMEQLRQIDLAGEMAKLSFMAERELRAAFVMNRIAEAEKISLTEEDLDAEIERRAEASNTSPEALIARLTKEDRLSTIEDGLIYEKTLQFLLDQAQVTNLTVTEEEAQRLEAEADQELTAKAARYLPPAAIKPVLEESSETSSNGDSGETVPSSPEGSSADETTGETAE
jgi:trigger factor